MARFAEKSFQFNDPQQSTNLGVRSSNLFGRAKEINNLCDIFEKPIFPKYGLGRLWEDVAIGPLKSLRALLGNFRHSEGKRPSKPPAGGFFIFGGDLWIRELIVFEELRM
jgi:hypothetical protein